MGVAAGFGTGVGLGVRIDCAGGIVFVTVTRDGVADGCWPKTAIPERHRDRVPMLRHFCIVTVAGEFAESIIRPQWPPFRNNKIRLSNMPLSMVFPFFITYTINTYRFLVLLPYVDGV